MHPHSLQVALPDLAATAGAAADIGRLLRRGDVILLEGPLGVGKSSFARALLRAVCRDPALEVPSPTFTLVQSYEIPCGVLHHFDLWRLDGPQDMTELGWDASREDIVMVEWPERLGATLRNGLPEDATLRVALALHLQESGARVATFSGWPGRLEEIQGLDFQKREREEPRLESVGRGRATSAGSRA